MFKTLPIILMILMTDGALREKKWAKPDESM